MHRKQSEERFRSMVRSAFPDAHLQKWRDVMYCPHCGKPIYKMDRALDYTLFLPGGRYVIVECKQAEDRFPYDDLAPGQRQMCEEWSQRTNVFVFILIKHKGRLNTYLIPYHELKAYEAISDRKSLSPEKDVKFLRRWEVSKENIKTIIGGGPWTCQLDFSSFQTNALSSAVPSGGD